MPPRDYKKCSFSVGVLLLSIKGQASACFKLHIDSIERTFGVAFDFDLRSDQPGRVKP
jgi:hypothetical protein